MYNKHIGDIYLDGTDIVIITDVQKSSCKVYDQWGIESDRSLVNAHLVSSYIDTIKQFEVKLCGAEI